MNIEYKKSTGRLSCVASGMRGERERERESKACVLSFDVEILILFRFK